VEEELLQGEPGVAGAVALGGGIRGQRQGQGRGSAGRVVAAEPVRYALEKQESGLSRVTVMPAGRAPSSAAP